MKQASERQQVVRSKLGYNYPLPTRETPIMDIVCINTEMNLFKLTNVSDYFVLCMLCSTINIVDGYAMV